MSSFNAGTGIDYRTSNHIRSNHFIDLFAGATLSEAFYGLERKLVISHGKLSTIRLSYLVTVLLPYILDKLDKFHKTQLEVVEDNTRIRDRSVSSQS